ncbi:MAG: DUF4369 domain-containing protein [Prevotella sp.]
MTRYFTALIIFAALTSCAGSYNIEGSSNVPTLDGRMLFLKVLENNEIKSVDSCDILHGKFHFTGTIDTMRMATLFMDDNGIMPLVLEKGDIQIKIDNTQQKVSGTPLNDRLTEFLEEYNRIIGEMNELQHQQDRAIMDGKDMDKVNAVLAEKADKLAGREDKLITTFITDNMDNILGPFCFYMVTSAYNVPQLSPWIDDIMSKATDTFKNDPYVKDYYQKAMQNEAIMNGTAK